MITLMLVIVAAKVSLFWFLHGNFKINTFVTQRYPVRGVDVSSYQGKIDWNELANQHIQFAYIKATEGSHLVDKDFSYNYEHALKTNLYVGAYHFFSYESSGIDQANHFIATVPKNDKMLPPVVDVEFYGNNEKHPPQKAEITKNLTELLKKLQAYYGKKPIIYATRKSYDLYIAGSTYADYDIWLSNVLLPPFLLGERKCTFWQYSDESTLKGYNGTDNHIDMNVFCGSENEFTEYIKSQKIISQ